MYVCMYVYTHLERDRERDPSEGEIMLETILDGSHMLANGGCKSRCLLPRCLRTGRSAHQDRIIDLLLALLFHRH